MCNLLKDGNKSFEKPIDELLLVYTQLQECYIEMARSVPVVKLVRLKDDNLDVETFMSYVGSNKQSVKAVFFDDVSWWAHTCEPWPQ